jgi:hypothetical protein
MFVTIRSYTGSKDLVDALVENESDVKELLTDIDGFKAYYLIRTSDGETTSISVYDDQNGAEASSSAAADWIRENLSDLSVSPPQVTAGEAVLSF